MLVRELQERFSIGPRCMKKDEKKVYWGNPDWEGVANSLLEQEKFMKQYNHPEPTGVIIVWKGNSYIGSIQKIVPGFSKDIILLSKSSSPLCDELIGAIKKLDKERLELYAEDILDLEGRQHVLRILEKENKLVYMSEEQTKYMYKNLPDIIELS